MEHDKYWAERFEQLTEAELRKADDLSAEMVREYRQTAQDLNDDIQRWYARFAAENKMSLAEARRVLTGRELAEFRWTVDEYIKYAKKADLSEAYIQKLKNASARVHIDRLETIRMQMAQHVEKLAAKGNARLTDVLRDIYPDAQMRTAYEVQKKKGFEPFARIPEADVDRILKKPWVSDGLNFSDRIWRDKERLLNTLQGELTRGLIRGEPYGKIAQRIAGRMGVARSAAARLVETEAAFFSSRGQLDAFRDLGVEQYEFVATLDSRTSETCREMDGKVLPLSEFRPGITAPPLHCHCRSTTCPYFDDEFTEGETRAARDPETGKTVQVDSRLSYEEWKEKYVEKLSEEKEPDIMNTGGDNLEQAKKRDHKIMITDIAVSKVSLVEIPGFSSAQNESLRTLHKELLRDAQLHNNSNEVAYAVPIDFSRRVVTYGKEDRVSLQLNTELASLKKSIYANELILAHNHPSTSTFSIADIATFVFDPHIGLMTVVTNQGEVHVLQKGGLFEYNSAKELLDYLIKKYRLHEDGTESNQESAAHEFLKSCRKAGVWYGRSK